MIGRDGAECGVIRRSPTGDCGRTRPLRGRAVSLLPRQLSVDELALFAGVGTRRTLAAGEMIFGRGEIGRHMFVVKSGQVRLEFGDGLANKTIGVGEFFGDLALFIGNHARVAHAVAEGDCVVLIIDQHGFDSLVDSEPRTMAQFMRRSFSYLVASEQRLVHSLRRRNEDLMQTLDSLRRTQSRLSTAQRLVQTDDLTGLCNRRGLYVFLDKLDQQRVPDTVPGLLLIDLDHFKRINDHHGHLLGDDVLRAVAAEVEAAALSCDLPCRLGGDEFALLAQVRSREELCARAERLLQATRALRFASADEPVRVAVSIGGRLCRSEQGWAVWYSEADALLYAAKGAGGDCWRLCTSATEPALSAAADDDTGSLLPDVRC